MSLIQLLTAVLLRNRKGFSTIDALSRDLYAPRTTVREAVEGASQNGLVRQAFGPSAGGYWYELTDKGREALKRRSA